MALRPSFSVASCCRDAAKPRSWCVAGPVVLRVGARGRVYRPCQREDVFLFFLFNKVCRALCRALCRPLCRCHAANAVWLGICVCRCLCRALCRPLCRPCPCSVRENPRRRRRAGRENPRRRRRARGGRSRKPASAAGGQGAKTGVGGGHGAGGARWLAVAAGRARVQALWRAAVLAAAA